MQKQLRRGVTRAWIRLAESYSVTLIGFMPEYQASVEIII